MAVIDVDGLIAEVSPDSPCGDDLEYDPEFQELERASQGREGHAMGDAVIEAEGPDWRGVRKLATSILGRSKDMRAAVHLTRALIHTDGFVGLRDGLAVLKGLVEGHWECVHPQLDPDDDNDPTFRLNTLVTLIDADTMLRSIRETPLVRSRALGEFSYKHVLIAKGEMSAPAGEEPPNLQHISAAFQDCDVEELQATAEAAIEAGSLMTEIESFVTDQVGAAQAVDLSDFGEAMKPVQKALSRQLERRGVSSSADVVEEAAPVAADAGGGGGAPAPAMPQGGQPISGDIQSREDAIRMLDRVIEYFNKYEPSSPIPLLLIRAKRLVSKSFMEIMQDLAPDGLAQAQLLGGSSNAGGGGGGGGGWGDSGGGGGGGGGGEAAAAEPANGGSDDGW